MKPFAALSMTLFLSCLLSGCAVSPTVASSGMGDDSAAIKDARNRRQAVLSDSEYANQRRQRANVAEEMELERLKQQRMKENVLAPFDLARGMGLGLRW